MKAKSVALLSVAGMLLTSVSVYSLTPPHTEAVAAVDVQQQLVGGEGLPSGSGDLSSFTAGKTLTVEGRVGHARMAASGGDPRTGRAETFVLLEVRGSGESSAKVAAPVNLSLVIDRSGSMRGTRLRNAQNAAIAAVDRLHHGDVVSVLAFDTRSSVVVPPTTIGSGMRERVAADIRGITLGGDTCISCGLEDGLAQLERTTDKVNRMILLSDGQATAGVRDEPAFRSLAQRVRDSGVTVTTIGVDVDYNERIMAAIAQEANGQHYFVENDAALAKVFEAEADALTSTIASGAEATIDLPAGVELDHVFGRSFRRSGSRVVVPLGTFASGEVKTVLMKVRVPVGTPGVLPVAGVELAYKDLSGGSDGRCEGKLATLVVADAGQASALDPVVATRVQRSETAQVLQTANILFASGRLEEAKQKLDTQAKALRAASSSAAANAPAKRAKDIGDDFDKQLAAVNETNSGFASPPPAPVAAEPGAAPRPSPKPQDSRQGKAAGKKSAELSNAFDR